MLGKDNKAHDWLIRQIVFSCVHSCNIAIVLIAILQLCQLLAVVSISAIPNKCNELWGYFCLGTNFAIITRQEEYDLKVAFTIWGNRISPVFDSARKLFIVETKDNKIISTQYEPFESVDSDLTHMINGLGINVLICGAISKRFSDIIEISEIELIPFITGYVDAVLESYMKNNEIVAEFFMPGCRNKYYRQKNRGNGFFNKKAMEVNMSRSDGTGPQGKGTGTGRKQGPCQGNSQGTGNGRGKSQGQGQKIGRGQGKGQGRGQGRQGQE